MSFDLKTVPLSRYGSYLAISHLPPAQEAHGGPLGQGLYLRDVHGIAHGAACLKLTPMLDGAEADCNITGHPDHLHIDLVDGGYIQVVFDGTECVRLRGENAQLRLEAAQEGKQIVPRGEDRHQIHLRNSQTSLMMVTLHGRLEIDAPWRDVRNEQIRVDVHGDLATRKFELAIEQYTSEWRPRDFDRDFDDCRREVAEEFNRWMRNIPRTPRSLSAARQLAGYVLWSCVVAPSGVLRRPSMLMSKNRMTRIWSWDNCFNAMALALGGEDELAWEQLMTLMDFQNDLGAIPDAVDDLRARWQCVKPPVYGWALGWIEKHTDLMTDERLAEIYPLVGNLTNFWLTCRDDDGDGICQYNHGNDSGWDNSTIFAAGCPVESPDLAAWLILQMDWLASASSRLGYGDQAEHWRSRAEATLERMLEVLWHEDQFVARVPESQWRQPQESGDTLLLYMPIILGERLDEQTRSKMIASLRQSGRFFTSHGYATESPKSPLHESDGYWRGPIWAPPTMILADGLARSGQEGLAHEIARRFCRMCASGGFAENFDAQTGQPLRDRAYTWTASVFLILARMFLVDER